MAKKKKNIKNQTFDVYPYLDQYQYLMRNGGALPWYQTEGPIEETVEEEEVVKTKTLEDYLDEGFSQEEAQKMFDNQAVTGDDEVGERW